MKIAIVGLSLSSSWGNGHATTYRSLVKALGRRGHQVAFFERRESWYAANQDYESEELCFYSSADELLQGHLSSLASADLVVVGSFVRDTDVLVEGLETRRQGVLAFYDIDTPVTVTGLVADACPYLTRELVPRFDLYLSFSGGTVLHAIEAMGAQRARPLYCSVDPDVHAPASRRPDLDLGYLGTYSADRQPALAELLLEPARQWRDGRFAVAGPQYPATESWPENVSHVAHLPAAKHAAFYCRQRFTLNVTRADMRRMGYSPSVRLFEAACCGTPVISDDWEGLDAFFEPGAEILVAAERDEVLDYVRRMPDDERRAIADAARRRVLTTHTGDQRARELEAYHAECV
jgi:spore maturation protein CgeB